MKIIITPIIIGVLSSLLFTSCEKANIPNGSGGDCKISAVSGFFPKLATISYDTAGRIDTISAGAYLLKIFTYSGSNVKVETIKNAITEIISEIELDANKNIIKQLISFKDGSLEIREYSYANAHLAQERVTKGSNRYTIEYVWEGGNLIKTKPNAGVNINEKIEYYTDLSFQKGDVNYITQLMKENWDAIGITSNLVKSNYSQDSISYKADNSGKITQAKIVRPGYNTQTLNYQYTCK